MQTAPWGVALLTLAPTPESPMQIDHWTKEPRNGVTTLTRTLKFPDWKTALAFVNAIGAIGEAQDHHALVELEWGRVTIHVWSHDVKGLSDRDERYCRAVNELAAA